MKNILFIGFLLSALVVFSCISRGEPEQNRRIVTKRPLPDEHEIFIASFYPLIHAENNFILTQRTHLEWLREKHWFALHFGNHLLWLNQVGTQYGFDSLFFHQSLTKQEFGYRIDSLLFHVDIIPDKLVMAQAVIESGWGKSHLAKKANNYFGMRCFRRGCGIPPHGIHSPDYWHKKYPTVADGVRDYLLNLNTANAYKDLRMTRMQLRIQGLEPDAVELANELKNYSELGVVYIKMIKEIMENYLPQELEKFADTINIQ